MWLIYSASSDQNSAQNSSRIIGPIIRFFHPAITPAGMAKALFLARKVAHLTVYAVLSYLLWLAFMGTMKRNLSRWNWRPVIYSFALIALYAISDEIHQRFVPSRTGTPWDVLIDCTGGAVALCAIWVVGRWRRRW